MRRASLLLLGLTISLVGRAHAAEPDVVVLSTGRRMEGTVVDRRSDGGVVLQFANSRKLLFPRTVVVYAGRAADAPQPGSRQPVVIEANRSGLVIVDRRLQIDRGRTSRQRHALAFLGTDYEDRDVSDVPICTAPCKVALEPRMLTLVVGRDPDALRILAEAPSVPIAGPTTIHIGFTDRRSRRILAGSVLVASILGGLVVAFGGSSDDSRPARMVGGFGIAALGGVAFGLIGAPDDVRVWSSSGAHP